MKRLSLFISTAICVLLSVSIVSGRGMGSWSYQQLLDKSDLVVIAIPSATFDTKEQTDLPGFPRPLGVVGVETKCDISAVFKGDPTLKHFVLHHYRTPITDKLVEASVDGPSLLSFDTSKKQAFLIFLVREADGRYAPTSGQSDPAFFAAHILTEPLGMAQAPYDELAHHHSFDDARVSDTSRYPVITEYLKGSDDQPKPGEWMPQSGHAQIFYFPKEVAEIIGSTRPGPLISHLVAYFDHPEAYSMHRLRSLILVSLAEKPLSTTVPYGSSDFQKEDMRCFFVPWYMATILDRAFPKTTVKADWIAYFDTLHLFSIGQP